MMKQEFIEMTGYTPTDEEYHYIEESYYDADTPYKSEFCKQWKKDKQSGKWAMEMKLRKMLDEQKAEYEEKIAEQRGYLIFYREQYAEKRRLEETVKRQSEKIEALKRGTERLAAVFEI